MATDSLTIFARDYEATKALAESYKGMMAPLSYARPLCLDLA